MKTKEEHGTDLDQLTILSRHTIIKGGSFEVGHDVTIRGTLEGNVVVGGRIDVLNGAEVNGSVRAVEAVIAGAVRGDLTVDGMLILRSTSVVDGSIRAGMIAVEEGASGGITVCAGPDAAEESAEERRRTSRRERGDALARARAAVAAARGETLAEPDPVQWRSWTNKVAVGPQDESRRLPRPVSSDRLISSPDMQEFLSGKPNQVDAPARLGVGLPKEEPE